MGVVHISSHLIFRTTYEEETIITTVLQISNLRFREVKELAQGWTCTSGQSETQDGALNWSSWLPQAASVSDEEVAGARQGLVGVWLEHQVRACPSPGCLSQTPESRKYWELTSGKCQEGWSWTGPEGRAIRVHPRAETCPPTWVPPEGNRSPVYLRSHCQWV